MNTYRIKRADPELLRQIYAAGTSSRSIEAIFTLDLPLQNQPPEAVEEATKRILGRVERQLGYKPHRVSVFAALGSFAVSADGFFLRTMIDDPEIESAMRA